MADFEPPKPIALSDSELSAKLEALRLEPNHLELMQQLLAEQSALREQDEYMLDAWKKQLGELGGFDPSTVEIAVIEQELAKISSNQAAVSTPTGPMPVMVKRQGPALRSLTYWLGGISNWLLIAIFISILTQFADLSASEILISVPLGIFLAALVVIPMKSKPYHPLLQIVRPFGTIGRYWIAAILLSAAAYLFFQSIQGLGSRLLGASVDPQGLLFAVAAFSGGLLSLVISNKRFEIALGVVTFGFAVLAFFSGTYEWPQGIIEVPSDLDWLISGLAISASVILIKVFGTPHMPSKVSRLPEQLILGGLFCLGLSLTLSFSGSQWLYVATALAFVVFLSLGMSSRDSSSSLWGRVISVITIAVAVIWITLSPAYDFGAITGAVIAGLATILMVVFIDLLGRRSAIHSASMESRHGFYGGQDWVSLIPFAISATLVWSIGSGYLSVSLTGNSALDAAFIGLIVGLVAGVLRIHRVHEQEKEILIVAGGSASLNNLLGL